MLRVTRRSAVATHEKDCPSEAVHLFENLGGTSMAPLDVGHSTCRIYIVFWKAAETQTLRNAFGEGETTPDTTSRTHLL